MNSIPKIIHQTYKTFDTIPEKWIDTPNSWKKNNPEWKYMFWSDDDCRNLIKDKYSFFLDVYDNYEYAIQKFDSIRCFILYEYGGLYVDMDIQCRKPIDDLFINNEKDDSDVYLVRSQNTPTSPRFNTTNCIMASKKRSEFWKRCFYWMMKSFEEPEWWWFGKHNKVMFTTGPGFINEMLDIYDGIYNIGTLDQALLLPCGMCDEKPCSNEDSYTILVDGCSWLEFDSKVYNFFYCKGRKVLYIIIVILLCYCLCM